MAEKIRDKKGDVICIAMNSSGYSVTTNKQKWCVKRAIPSYIETIHIPECKFRNPSDAIKSFQDQYYEACKKIKTARSKKDEYLSDANHAINSMARYIKLAKKAGVKVDMRRVGKQWKTLMAVGADFDQAANAGAMREQEIKKAIAAARKAKREQFKNDRTRLKEWIDGQHRRFYSQFFHEAYLRIKDGRVETSQGVSVSVREAKVLADRILAGKDVRGHTIEGFTVIGWNGALKIGCHTINRDEVIRISNELKNL